MSAEAEEAAVVVENLITEEKLAMQLLLLRPELANRFVAIVFELGCMY